MALRDFVRALDPPAPADVVAAIQSQIDQFLRTGGNVQQFCLGPCNPD